MSTDDDTTRDHAASRTAGGQGRGSIRNFDDEQLERDVEAAVHRFTWQPPKPEDQRRYDMLTTNFREMAEIIVRNVPPGRERETALTCLSEARMHANAGIALHGTKGA